MSTEQHDLIKALGEIAGGSLRSKISRLREIFDEVEAAKAAGASNKIIVEVLKQHGLIFDVNNFKNARCRILKERKMQELDLASRAVALDHHPEVSGLQHIPHATDRTTGTQFVTLPSEKRSPNTNQKRTVALASAPSGAGRPSILNHRKGIFGELKPAPIDGSTE